MYKLIKQLPETFKIKVNPKQSKVLQEHLFSIGKGWASRDQFVQHTEWKLLNYEMGLFRVSTLDHFDRIAPKRIRFKDYFAKEIFMLPEKWCIEVTQDNCEELNVYLHRNWKDYEDYKDTWEVTFDNESDLFFSSSKIGWNKGTKDVFYELITTEQFRKQFGTITETKAEIEAIESNLEFWKKQAKNQRQSCSELRRERWEMSKQIESLKTTIEAIKEIIQDNPIIKK